MKEISSPLFQRFGSGVLDERRCKMTTMLSYQPLGLQRTPLEAVAQGGNAYRRVARPERTGSGELHCRRPMHTCMRTSLVYLTYLVYRGRPNKSVWTVGLASGLIISTRRHVLALLGSHDIALRLSIAWIRGPPSPHLSSAEGPTAAKSPDKGLAQVTGQALRVCMQLMNTKVILPRIWKSLACDVRQRRR